jgi:hypothetical protein
MKTSRRISISPVTSLLAAALLATACGGSDDGDGSTDCIGGKCDAVGDVSDLEGFDDLIAVWLRSNIDEDGNIDVEYLDMLTQIAEQEGCTQDSIASYVISDELVAEEGTGPFPRVVNTVCSADRTKADMAFFALSFANAAGTDVDTRSIEMFAWDPSSLQYRFYKTEHVEGSDTKVRVQPEPAECAGCHGTPEHIDGSNMHLLPIMNELSAPWEHWFAQPISVNHVVAPEVASAPHFAELAGEGSRFRSSASLLEQTIRTAFSQRVAPARLRERRGKPADPELAMSLLRPLFCDEQVTYITEDGASGLLSSSSVVDDGLHSVYFQVKGTGWTWEWWNDRILRINPPGAPDAVNMMPVRGAAMVAYEKQLMAARGLTAEQVTQIRALDWGTAALSDFRCDLWHSARDRVLADPPATDDSMRTMQLFEPLLAEILTLVPKDHGLAGDLPAEIPITAAAGRVISLQRADTASLQTLAEALVASDVAGETCGELGQGVCEVDIDTLGALIEARFKAIESGGRDFLNAERNVRACQVQKNFPNRPFIPDVDCAVVPDDPGADGGATDDGGSTGGDGGTTGGAADTGGADVGTCCTEAATSGCSDATIEACVCAMDDFCCSGSWDATCVENVDMFGCGMCP